MLPLPKDFIWGTATASAQIEGAATLDGKGESIWDRFASLPGRVIKGHTPAIACDHYHRYEEDIALMASLGIKHYRFSIAWPRVFPAGDGAVNLKGLEFYSRLVDCLLRHGITPHVTLFHWDLPQALEDRGGWTNRLTAEAFLPYAETVVKHLGDRVKHWFTQNEMTCFIGHGYELGIKAPGRKEPRQIINQAYHHALLAHGYGVQAVRAHGGPGAKVMLVQNCDATLPFVETEPDIAAARQAFHRINGFCMQPLFKGSYPEWIINSPDAPQVQPGDMELIAGKTDGFGLNIYTGLFYKAGTNGQPEYLTFGPHYPTPPLLGWLKFTPQCIYWGTRFIHELYAPGDIFITENGVAYQDTINTNGQIVDLHRVEYLKLHLAQVHRAVADGLPLRGYFQWSFMDNYEWSDGYDPGFGLVHVDRETLKRTPKLSAEWYARCIAANAVL
ncbi:MAG: GH1 family beta-glucosidase [Verrucomicrobiota bacterium]|nr:GH1 family beta-glucosidase [Verrucomicrobiota bacterium]